MLYEQDTRRLLIRRIKMEIKILFSIVHVDRSRWFNVHISDLGEE